MRGARSAEGRATPAAQRAALIALYNTTDGPNWTRNSNWDTTAPVADWYGVTTDTNGSLTRLYLHRNRLTGTIPTEIGNLTQLHLHVNQLTSIPTEIGNLTNLTRLHLDGNRLTGCVPAALSTVRCLDLDAGVSFCVPASPAM